MESLEFVQSSLTLLFCPDLSQQIDACCYVTPLSLILVIPTSFATQVLKTHTTRRFDFTSVLGLRARLQNLSDTFGSPWQTTLFPLLSLSPSPPTAACLTNTGIKDVSINDENTEIGDRKSTRLNSSHRNTSRMPSSA